MAGGPSGGQSLSGVLELVANKAAAFFGSVLGYAGSPLPIVSFPMVLFCSGVNEL
jgi:hypothetical protein